ncbi:BCD family MFS transporter [Acuticoccus kandeliae]|uniref:BCD family MFS transporter n=1 Tax=Acuticoccus kandeliae TaxID=2073160 RepID=UPI000D3EA510|nr:BCD family MFS transporter [Acuticoccus kandeliae]
MSLARRIRVVDFSRVSPRLLPFADAASETLPLPRLLRLSLFQVSVGMAVVLITGTLNRVMIVEMGVPAWIVSVMIALPLVFAPLRALIGFRSDEHRSILGWRRVPYVWFGTLLQFGGLAIMPFALLLLSEGGVTGPSWAGEAGAALAFLLVGAGLHTTQTAGLALATDIAPTESRPRVVALLYVMLLVGMLAAALAFGQLLADFSNLRLIQVIQGAALVTVALNVAALWKQETRNPRLTAPDRPRRAFLPTWRAFANDPGSRRLLVTTALGTAGFSMQDVLLEPYGAQVLGLSVGETTELTALLAGGTLIGFTLSASMLGRGVDPHRLGGYGALVGIVAFAIVTLAGPLASPILFALGAGLIGVGGGLFVIATLVAAMALADGGRTGLALGAWGAVQATAAGVAIAAGGALRDAFGALATSGALGPALSTQAVGYSVVYQIEIALLFATLVAIGPLARYTIDKNKTPLRRFGLADLPN